MDLIVGGEGGGRERQRESGEGASRVVIDNQWGHLEEQWNHS